MIDPFKMSNLMGLMIRQAQVGIDSFDSMLNVDVSCRQSSAIVCLAQTEIFEEKKRVFLRN